jgi:hypothetical protein
MDSESEQDEVKKKDAKKKEKIVSSEIKSKVSNLMNMKKDK